MARIETDPNYTAPTFPRATAPNDIFKKEDVQMVAAALSTHIHDGAGQGLHITNLPGVITIPSGGLSINGGPVTINSTLYVSGAFSAPQLTATPGPLTIGSATIGDGGSGSLGLSGSVTIPAAASFAITSGPTINANGITFAGGGYVAGSAGNVTIGGPTTFAAAVTAQSTLTVNGALSAAVGVYVVTNNVVIEQAGSGIVFGDTNSRVMSQTRVSYFDEYAGGWWWRDSAASLFGALHLTNVGYMALGSGGNPIASLHVSAKAAGTAAWNQLGNAGASNPNTLGNGNGVLYIEDPGAGAGNGGAVLFGASGGHYFAAIKGFLNNGSANGTGDLSFATRNAAGDTTLTERMRILTGAAVQFGDPAAFPALSGMLRLPNAQLVAWRNGTNSGDCSISIDSSNNLIVNGVTISGSATAGVSGTLPAQVSGYLVIDLNGSQRKIPYYQP